MGRMLDFVFGRLHSPAMSESDFAPLGSEFGIDRESRILALRIGH